MVNTKLNQEIVLFGNAKDFKSDAVFAKIVYVKWEMPTHSSMYSQKQLTRFKAEEYLSTVV